MDIPPRPSKAPVGPLLVNLLLGLLLAAAGAGIGVTAHSLGSRHQALLERARSQADGWLGPQGSSAPTIPLHALDPAAKLGKAFRLFSQTPLNLDNIPDDLERQALLQFQKGAAEFFQSGPQDGVERLRYIRPLTVDASCLRCHADQGYAEGQRRGGIEVSFDIAAETAAGRRDAALLVVFCAAAAALAAASGLLLRRSFRSRTAALEARLAEMADTDELTGLANRRYFFRRFDEEVARALRHGRALGVIMIDIDHFKHINDFYGHQVGDQALQLLADHLKGNCRVSDLVARYGGEEFVILLPEIDRAGAQVLAEKLRSLVAQASVRLAPGQAAGRPDSGSPGADSGQRFDPAVLRFTVSLGVACVDAATLKDLQPPSRLVALADAALYKAKHTGRNRVMVHVT